MAANAFPLERFPVRVGVDVGAGREDVAVTMEVGSAAIVVEVDRARTKARMPAI